MTRVSIIMATRNAERFLAQALASVPKSLADPTIEYEILVADGASSDGTLAIAAGHPGVRVVSQSDAGIYDGMNRALAAATAPYCLILNSDDVLIDGALGQALRALDRQPDAGFASSAALFGAALDGAVSRGHHGPLTAAGAMFGIPAINARLFRRATLDAIGPIRADLGLAADREFLLRLASSGLKGVKLDDPLYLYRIHEGSHTISGDAAGRERVYGAEIRLAEGLFADADPTTRGLARATGALAGLKQRLRGRSQGTHPSFPAGPIDLCRGVALALQWRGRLSGY